MKRRFYTVSSAAAFREGSWPRKGWGVFDRERGELLAEFSTRKEACRWRDKYESDCGYCQPKLDSEDD